MLPGKFLDRIRLQSYIDVPFLLSALERPGTVSIRLNPDKWNNIPVSSSPVPWCKSGFYLETRPSFTADPLFHSGCYYPQEASGMFLEVAYNQLFSGVENIKVLDLCGAPGGKSTHLSALIGNKGFLVANEVIRQRVSLLAENIAKWGIPNTLVTNNDPSAFAKLTGYFDLVVVDAPCSGEGMFRDEVARGEWSEANASLCSERQRRILSNVWPALKYGGILIYSTCTFNPAENEENIKWLTEKTDSESVKIDISSFTGIQEISCGDITGYGFYPGKIEGDGFFLSVIRKLEKTEELRLNKKKINYSAASSDIKIAGTMINNFFCDIYRHDDTVYKLSLPVAEFLSLRNFLKIIKGGTALFRTRKDDISPLHELAVSCLIKKDVSQVCDLDYGNALSFLRRENFNLKNHSEGWILLRYLGVNLGFVKNIGTRINNYFPVDWRIRLGDSRLSYAKPVSWQ
jgi:16S rRNA C967 or C1407 C5-methylase (RsmB/RsmF family)/NOL1/NOP2/fmu family ribosome biogenesis protein